MSDHEQRARDRFAGARVARLATADGDGRPHLVPITFAMTGDTIFSAVDHKPKTTTALRRLANIAANPRAAVLVDHYDEDWATLWWARADGSGRVLDPREPAAVAAIDLLVARYAQYRRRPPSGPVLAITVERWSYWSSSPPPSAAVTAG